MDKSKTVKKDGIGKYIEVDENTHAKKETKIKAKLDEIDGISKDLKSDDAGTGKKCKNCKKCAGDAGGDENEETVEDSSDDTVTSADSIGMTKKVSTEKVSSAT